MEGARIRLAFLGMECDGMSGEGGAGLIGLATRHDRVAEESVFLHDGKHNMPQMMQSRRHI